MSRIAAIVPAAGLGTRMGAETPKQFLELDGMPLIIFTLRRLAACTAITDFFISTRADDVVSLEDKVAKAGLGRPARVVHGGDSRQQSVANALAQVDPSTEIVLVHDAVRPFVTLAQIDRVIAEARARGAAILGIPAIDTVKEVKRASSARGYRSDCEHHSARAHRPRADAAGFFVYVCCAMPFVKPSRTARAGRTKLRSSNALGTTCSWSSAPSAISKSRALPIWISRASTLNRSAARASRELCA